MSTSKASRSPRSKDSEELVASVEKIVIDEAKGLVFAGEQELYKHFSFEIQTLEHEYLERRSEADFADEDLEQFDHELDELLDDPDEVWEDSESLADRRFFVYIKQFPDEHHYIACCYLTESTPSFVYLHFPTKDEKLVEQYRRGQLVFQRSDANVPIGAIDGDALHEGDELADGLYKAMLLVRSEKDIAEEEFLDYAEHREPTLEEADEIWRSSDSMGNVLVSFIKDFNEEEEFTYVVVTVEDAPSGSHALLFSFPTRDKGLADRYRHGENLQAEEVVQESSH